MFILIKIFSQLFGTCFPEPKRLVSVDTLIYLLVNLNFTKDLRPAKLAETVYFLSIKSYDSDLLLF